MDQELLFKRAFEGAAIGLSFVAVKPFGRYLGVNPAFCQMTGYSEDELLKRNFQSITPTADVEDGTRAIQALVDGSKLTPVVLEKQYVRKNGSLFWARLYISVIQSDLNTPSVLSIQIQDIDQERKVEVALRESEVRYRTLVERSPDIVLIYSNGKVAYINPSGARFLGTKDVNDIIGLSALDIIHPDDRSVVKERIDKLQNGVLEIAPLMEQKFLRLDGTSVDVEVVGIPFQFQGRMAIQVIAHDISQRKEGERKLRRQAAAFHELLGIHTNTNPLEEERVFDSVVTSLARLFEVPIVSVERCSHKESVSLSLWHKGKIKKNILFLGIDNPCQEISRSGISVQHKGSLKKYFPHSAVIHNGDFQVFLGVPVVSSAGEVLCVISILDNKTRTFSFDDIEVVQLFGQVVSSFIEQKQMQEKLQHGQRIEAVGQLAGGVAHEFNNLLTVIIGYLHLVISKVPQDSPLLTHLARIDQSADRAAKLTRQILAFSRQSPIDLQPGDLEGIARDVIELLRQTIDRRILLSIKVGKDLRAVLIDEDTMGQVVMNLMVNARDALKEKMAQENTESGEGEWRPTIRIRIDNVHLGKAFCRSHPGSNMGDYVRLLVDDNGPGVDPKIRPHIFEPFFSTKALEKGTGLGLSTTYGIVKQHRGWIGLAAASGEWTSFEVYLPCVDEAPGIKDTEQEGMMVGGSECVLFVDDEASIRKLGEAILTKCGYSVRLAADGEKALKAFKKDLNSINLVILDLTLPGKSGWDVFSELRSINPLIKIIISSGQQIPDHLFARGGSEVDFFLKPYRPNQLVKKVREVLDRK